MLFMPVYGLGPKDEIPSSSDWSQNPLCNRLPAYFKVRLGILTRGLVSLAKALPRRNYKSSYIQNHLIAGKLLTTYAVAILRNILKGFILVQVTSFRAK